ncbi:MAG: hypothetical protein EGQ87_07565 [Clostridiales bacterium]|nr:hypothetical protein [Clostridiales bacterium]
MRCQKALHPRMGCFSACQ